MSPARKKKILLIQPPIRDFYRTRFREYPLGLMYLAASLLAAGHEVKLLDARACKKPKLVSPHPELADVQRLHAASGLWSRFFHFGMPFDQIGSFAADLAPDIVCINSMFTPYEREVFETARAIKDALPKCRIIAGGCHATADPDSHLASGVIDCVIAGEGEVALPRLVDDDCLRGVFSGDEGGPFISGDLEPIHFPARHLIDGSKYAIGRRPYTMVLTSRGCPHRCSFCSTHVVAGSTHRTRTVDAVIREIDECVHEHGIRAIDFQDDNFLFDRERALDILTRVADRYDGEVEFMATNGLNAVHLDLELLRLFKRCGFRKLDIALATGAVKSRGKMTRPETVAKYESVVSKANEIGLAVTTYVILGFPTQPLSDMTDSIEYLKTVDTLIAPSIFYNVPGMPIFEEMKRYECSDSNTARRSSAINCRGDDFERDDISRLMADIRTYNLSKNN